MTLRAVRHPEDLEALDGLFAVCHEADGHWPLGEHKYLGLVRGGGEPSIGIVAQLDDALVGYAHLSPNREDGGWGLEMAVHPLSRGGDVTEDLLRESLRKVSAVGGRSLRVWVFRPALAGTLFDLGFVQERELRQLRCHLPLGDEPAFPPGVDIRRFVPGQDESAWLGVNNRAFAGHPENGAWTKELLADRQAQSWFDPQGFLMSWEGDRLTGFCWTKTHDDSIGEIYVIAVDPDRQGRGLGKALAQAGLAHLHRAGGCSTGMLYVDAANEKALALYESMGFWVDHIDRSFLKIL